MFEPEVSSGPSKDGDAEARHVDVLIVGAGLSGIGAACHLVRESPGKSFAILEARDTIGGTWDLFRYPGIRSDSDMFTLGYNFRPWEAAESIADGPSILSYVRETARDYDIDRHIHFGHRAVLASWSSRENRWTVEVEVGDGERVKFSCDFLLGCTGYYSYESGFTPQFEGAERFRGQIVHPQHWPEDLDYSGKRVVVIGSGATAVTLVPAMAKRAEQVTMLQRSPSWVVSLPGRDPIANVMLKVLPARVVYPLMRWKNVFMQLGFFHLSRRIPRVAKAFLRYGVQRRMPADFDIATHFRPSYNPWDQRVCLVPDGDLFDAICEGSAAIVTDRIRNFTETGLLLESGQELEADVIVTATGLNLLAVGGAEIEVDGERVELGERVFYKGMMLSGVPNAAITLGYTNASWTLKADLVAEYVCRLLNHMDAEGYSRVTPLPPPADEPTHPAIDLASGYVLRSLDELPRQGDRAPWRLRQNYPLDILMLRRGALEDEGVEFSRGEGEPTGPSPAVAEAA